DEIGTLPDVGGVGDQFGAVGSIIFIADAAALTRPGLDQHRVPGARQLLDADRNHGHAVLIRFDLLGHADDELRTHGMSSVLGKRTARIVGRGRHANQGECGSCGAARLKSSAVADESLAGTIKELRTQGLTKDRAPVVLGYMRLEGYDVGITKETTIV